VCAGDTGHAEVVKVVFDPSKVTYRQLCEGFFMMHDPTELNRQGPDVGEQYRSAIFCASPAQRATAEGLVKELTAAKAYDGKKIVTQIVDGGTFTAAEDYHQDYIAKTGRYCHGSNPWPKVLGAPAAR
jgi:methionine-S-sulfoxide reductase